MYVMSYEAIDLGDFCIGAIDETERETPIPLNKLRN